jgi:hypothetical protein
MDRVGEHVERRGRLDREDGLADRVRCPWRGDERAQQHALAAVDNDRDVTRRLGDVAGRGGRVVGRLLERVVAALERLVQLEPDAGLWGSV